MAVAAVLGPLLYTSTGSDDAHITSWAADALVQHGAYVNYSGERIELASSLLHVVIVAVVAAVTGASAPQTAHVLGVAFAALAVWTTGRLGARLLGVAGSAAALLATGTWFTYWSVGGLETTLAAWLTAAFLLCVHDGLEAPSPGRWAALLLCALGVCLVRPEGGLVALCALALAWVAMPSRRLAGVLGVVALAVVATAGVHLAWFGQVLPQPAYAKVGPLSVRALRSGAKYVGELLRVWWLPWTVAHGAALVGLGVRVARRREVPPAVVLAGAWVVATLGFGCLSGGDWMVAGRFWVPAMPAAALVVGWALAHLGPRRHLALGAIVAWQLVLGARFAVTGSEGMLLPVAVDAWQRTAALPGAEGRPWCERTNPVNIADLPLALELDEWVERISAQKGAPVTILSRQMGLVPYRVAQRHFGAIRVFDRRGLHDRHLLDCPASDGLVRLQVGLDLDYDHYFARLDDYAACGVPAPDVIFDIGDVRQWTPVLRRSGYRVVYRQTRDTSRQPRWWEPAIPWAGFIAVRRSLVGDAEVRRVDGSALWDGLAP